MHAGFLEKSFVCTCLQTYTFVCKCSIDEHSAICVVPKIHLYLHVKYQYISANIYGHRVGGGGRGSSGKTTDDIG